MDLLLTPADSSVTIEKAPYLGINLPKWDGGPFLTYAVRSENMHWINPILRLYFSELQSDKPCVDLFKPFPRPERDQFAQRWLFFGLAAELLGLNEQENGTRLVDATLAEAELANLYERSVCEDGGQQILTGAFILDSRPLILQRILSLESDESRRIRIGKLQRSLEMSWYVLSSWLRPNEDLNVVSFSVGYSIAALIESFQMELFVSISLEQLPKSDKPIANDCTLNYLRSNSVKERMLRSNWCKSDLLKFQDLYTGLNTVHYLSCLKKDNLYRDHSGCSENTCKAAQIDPVKYKTLHVEPGCKCDDAKIENAKINSILSANTGYPVLRLEFSETMNEVSIAVEEFSRDIPYIAISHVWADGLGNPGQNALPGCQISRLRNLISTRQFEDVKPENQEDSSMPYRVWIDTLCCPVDESCKQTALKRISDVYRNAKHVLVLDAALTSFKVTKDNIPEAILRIFACSTWMRRLWTLQEGALAQSIYFQFSNVAIRSTYILGCLHNCVQQDTRYMQLYMDIQREFTSITSFFQAPIFPGINSNFDWHRPTSDTLLRALRFRSVSVPSDEPLCIATLMSLDVGNILAAGKDPEDRMIEFWKLYAQTYGGIPPRIVFSLETPLKRHGWRWAPRTLLKTEDSTLSLHGKGGTLLSFEPIASPECLLGLPTPRGLKVQFSGFLLRTKPWRTDLALHALDKLQSGPEIFLFARSNDSSKYYRIQDEFRSTKLALWSDKEREQYDQTHESPLCHAIDPGERALIRDPSSPPGLSTANYLLVEHSEVVHDEQPHINAQELEVRGSRRLRMEELDDRQSLVARTIQKLAQEVALDETVTKLHALTNKESPDIEATVSAVRQKMYDVVSQVWDLDQDFADGITADWGPNKDGAWNLIPKCAPHDIILYQLPNDQTWIVD